jgi:HEPN domain-containing protein
MKEESKYWFEQAQSDLRASKHSLISRDFDWSCFQAQQAVEKSLKAIYLKKFEDLKKVHDLVFLAQKLHLPIEYIDLCVWFNRVYIEARYPDMSGVIPS